MLKNKRSVSACSLSSCRIRAEALARAFNNRIWNPCVWIPIQRSSEGDDGMPNGIDDEEEFFDASPSPVEVGDESMFCQQHSSAATDAGRAKLYELLQQHATDDAIDVFYDVSEEDGQTDANESCHVNNGQESDKVEDSVDSSDCTKNVENENNLLDFNEGGELKCESVSQIPDHPAHSEHLDSQELEIKSDKLNNELKFVPVIENSESLAYSETSDSKELSDELKHDTVIDSLTKNTSSNETNNSLQNTDREDIEETSFKDEKNEPNIETLSINTNVKPLGEGRFRVKKSLVDENGIPIEDRQKVSSTVLQNANPPLEDTDTPEVGIEANDLNTVQKRLNGESHSINAENVSAPAEENDIAIKVTVDADSPIGPSETSDTASSPTSRLQVFDELRPKISRSTSLKTGKTPPGTPSRKKIVRFADVLGLDLEDVRHVILGDLPNIPSSAYTDLNLKDLDLPRCEPISETVEISRRDSASWKSVTGATSTNVLYPMFPIPGEQSDFMDRVRQQGICLETIIVSEMSIQCTCRVMNYGYHKKVIARYTVNDWLTTNDIDATYVPGSSNGETDSFSFSIFLSPHNKNVKFALKYVVNNLQYWDNNKSQNYCLGLHGSYHSQHLPSISWQDQFW